MFIRSNSVLDMPLCLELMGFFREIIKNHLHEKEVHFSRAGRYCFENADGGDQYLKRILHCLLGNVDIFSLYEDPVVHHSFLLAKMPGGVATRLHQDRPYWREFEGGGSASMTTAWFSLGDIHEGNGCLLLNLANETQDIRRLNTNTEIFEHFSDAYSVKQGALTIQNDQAAQLRENLSPVMSGIGDLILFDAYEPHCSMPNGSEEPRLAFKVVLGEKGKLSGYYKPVRALLA